MNTQIIQGINLLLSTAVSWNRHSKSINILFMSYGSPRFFWRIWKWSGWGWQSRSLSWTTWGSCPGRAGCLITSSSENICIEMLQCFLHMILVILFCCRQWLKTTSEMYVASLTLLILDFRISTFRYSTFWYSSFDARHFDTRVSILDFLILDFLIFEFRYSTFWYSSFDTRHFDTRVSILDISILEFRYSTFWYSTF